MCCSVTAPLFSKRPGRTPGVWPPRQDEDSEKMTSPIAQNAGVDIAKDWLDVAIHPTGEAARFANDKNGLQGLIRWLAARRPARVVFEATGAYHRLFERT